MASSLDSSWRSDDDSSSIFSFDDNRLSANVFVLARIRPLFDNEITRGCKSHVEPVEPSATTVPVTQSPFKSMIVDMTANETNESLSTSEDNRKSVPIATRLRWTPTRPTMKPLYFDFDAVFPPDSGQEDVYNFVQEAVHNILKGFNTTLVAYGQSSTGKSFSMHGPPPRKNRRKPSGLAEDDGVMIRAIHDLFAAKVDIQETNDITLLFSYLEIHKNEIRDLLVTDGKTLSIVDGGKEGGVNVPGLSVVSLNSLEQAHELLHKVTLRRKTARLLRNRYSSRSHGICSVTAIVTSVEDPTFFQKGKLTMVDLPSTENMEDTGIDRIRRQEASRNNKDLLTLGRVILSLSSSKRHIPFRDCKLTRLLRDSLGSHCCTILISCVSPSDDHVEDTLKTLEYAQKARTISCVLEPNPSVQLDSVPKFRSFETLATQSVASGSVSSFEMMKPSPELSMLNAKMSLCHDAIDTLEFSSRDTDNETGQLPPPEVTSLMEKLESCSSRLREIESRNHSGAGSLNDHLAPNTQRRQLVEENLWGKLEELSDELRSSNHQRVPLPTSTSLNPNLPDYSNFSQSAESDNFLASEAGEDDENYSNEHYTVSHDEFLHTIEEGAEKAEESKLVMSKSPSTHVGSCVATICEPNVIVTADENDALLKPLPTSGTRTVHRGHTKFEVDSHLEDPRQSVANTCVVDKRCGSPNDESKRPTSVLDKCADRERHEYETGRECNCGNSTFKRHPEQADFYLPKLTMCCDCGIEREVGLKQESPLDLDSILRDWQVDFLNYLGIHDALVFIFSYERQGRSLAMELRRWRQDKGLKRYRTSLCHAALHIWNRTCKKVVKHVLSQRQKGSTTLERPSFLRAALNGDKV